MDYQTSETPDQNLLRGAKSIADWIVFIGLKFIKNLKQSSLVEMLRDYYLVNCWKALRAI